MSSITLSVADPKQSEEAVAATRIVAALVYGTLVVAVSPSGSSSAAVLAYAAYAASVYASVRRCAAIGRFVPSTLHLADLAIPLALGLAVPAARDMAGALCFIPLAAAATRWGARGTIATLAAALCVVGLAVRPYSSVALQHAGVAPLLIGGTAIALLGFPTRRRTEDEDEDAFVTDVRARCVNAPRFESALLAAVDGLSREFHATGAEVIVHHARAGRTFSWTLAANLDSTPSMQWIEVPPAGPAPRPREEDGTEPALRGAFVAGRWSGFVTLSCAPLPAPERARATARLKDAVAELAPLALRTYQASRARARAAARERARLARALHDGPVQSLIGAEMQIAALSRRAETDGATAQALGRVQGILRRETSSLRDLMVKMKPLDVAPDELPNHLFRIVDRFSHDSGIHCEFSADRIAAGSDLRRCAEVARIVREALANVRKHSGATRVYVYLRSSADGVLLAVQDNGRGFPFDGRVEITDTAELPSGRIPETIRESVRALGGSLVIRSKPGRGARLEIALPFASAEASTTEFHRVAS